MQPYQLTILCQRVICLVTFRTHVVSSKGICEYLLMGADNHICDQLKLFQWESMSTHNHNYEKKIYSGWLLPSMFYISAAIVFYSIKYPWA